MNAHVFSAQKFDTINVLSHYLGAIISIFSLFLEAKGKRKAREISIILRNSRPEGGLRFLWQQSAAEF